MIISHGLKSARLVSMHASNPRGLCCRILRTFRVLVLSPVSSELSAREVASARNAHSCVQCFVCCDAPSLTTQCCASPQWIGYHMHVSQCQMRERRSARTLPSVALRDKLASSTRTLPEHVRHDMIQSVQDMCADDRTYHVVA